MPNFTKFKKYLVPGLGLLAFLSVSPSFAQSSPGAVSEPVAVMAKKPSATVTKEYGPVKIEFLVNSVKAIPLDKTGDQVIAQIKAEIEDSIVDTISKNNLVVDGCDKGYGSLSIVDLGTKHSFTYVWAKEGEKPYDKMAVDVCSIFEGEIKRALSSMGKKPGELSLPGSNSRKRDDSGT